MKLMLEDSIQLPASVFELSEHLNLNDNDKANWAWLELSGAVLSRYIENPKDRLSGLIDWFYQELGFCARELYFSVEAADLASCVRTKQGNSTTLALLLKLLAKQLDLKLELVLLPGHTVLCSCIENRKSYFDPLTGEKLSRKQLHAFVRGELGNSAVLKPSYLKAATEQQIITRMLHEIKAACVIASQFEVAMECCNLLLQWHEDDLHLNRERAFIAQQLGCISVATADLQHFIDNNPHDPVTELVKIQLKELADYQEVFH